MKRRSFLATFTALPFVSELVLGSMPPVLVEPKVILLKTTVDFDLIPYEAASNTIRVDIIAEYDDGSVRNFTCDNQTWHYETRKCESHVVIGKDIVVYYCNQSDEDGHLTTVCTFKDAKESFGLKEL